MELYRLRKELLDQELPDQKMPDQKVAKGGLQGGGESLYSAGGTRNVKKKKSKKRKKMKPGMNREEMVMELFRVCDNSY